MTEVRVRLRHRRRGLGRRRAGGAAERGPGRSACCCWRRAATCGRPRSRSISAIPNPMRAIADDDFRWPTLLARRTEAQEPTLLWRGRGVGGSSLINGQIAIRGMPDDFERWAEAGCRGWGCRRRPALLQQAGEGPRLRRGALSRRRRPDPGLPGAGRALGPGRPRPEGGRRGARLSLVRRPQRARRHGRLALRDQQPATGMRVSTNDGYLEPARGRPNLTIVGDATRRSRDLRGQPAARQRRAWRGRWRSLSRARRRGSSSWRRRHRLARHPAALRDRARAGSSRASASRSWPTGRSARTSSTTRSCRSSCGCGRRRGSTRPCTATRIAACATGPASRGRARTT